MRHHFHRCAHLRIMAADASDLHGARRGGSVVLDELCDARKLTPCVGLVDCDILPLAQKRQLLVARATRMRETEGGASRLAGPTPERIAELRRLRSALLEERERIVELNRALEAEIAFCNDSLEAVEPADASELAGRGLSLRLDEASGALHIDRLDLIDRALEAMERGDYGFCAACRSPIGLDRLQRAPDALRCASCVPRS